MINKEENIMRKIYRFIAAAAAGALLLSGAACSKAKQGEYPVKIAGHEVTAEPQKVVCLSDNIADILIACGYTDAIVAKTDECDQPELDGVPSVGSRNNPSYSRIESLSPDVVFADKSVSADLVKKLDDNSNKGSERKRAFCCIYQCFHNNGRRQNRQTERLQKGKQSSSDL